MPKPLLAVTQGDPAGVGPETIVGAWADPRMHRQCRALVVGHAEIFAKAARLLGSSAQVVEIGSPEEARSSPQAIPCLPAGSAAAIDVPPATIDPRGGQAAYDALMKAIDLALAQRVDGIVTAPLHKAALWRAGHHYPGHTELLAERCGVRDFAMMLYLAREPAETSALPPPTLPSPALPSPVLADRESGLGVVHVTLHMALADVFKHLTTDAIVSKAQLVDRAMQAILGRAPRIGVCALNPHAGEEELFGDEETRIIRPAVEAAQKHGLQIEGPLPADTLMVRARDGGFDAVVAMYHDQGHIALKLLGMHRAVNVTLGLPIVRTSVAHGTAFDLAWQGKAETSSMVEAIRVGARLAERRNRSR